MPFTPFDDWTHGMQAFHTQMLVVLWRLIVDPAEIVLVVGLAKLSIDHTKRLFGFPNQNIVWNDDEPTCVGAESGLT